GGGAAGPGRAGGRRLTGLGVLVRLPSRCPGAGRPGRRRVHRPGRPGPGRRAQPVPDLRRRPGVQGERGRPAAAADQRPVVGLRAVASRRPGALRRARQGYRGQPDLRSLRRHPTGRPSGRAGAGSGSAAGQGRAVAAERRGGRPAGGGGRGPARCEPRGGGAAGATAAPLSPAGRL
ncbi:MAG: hypothetical protein AVDCRST_MAG61-2060, partial [uncultured Friedmanniella sp.]